MRRLDSDFDSTANFPALRILQISSAESLGGGERHLADLANGLAVRGHDVWAAVRPNSPLVNELATLPAKNIVRLALRNALDANSARSLARLVDKHRIQIVHAHMARDYPLAAYAVRKSPGARLIVTRHVLFSLNRLHRITLASAARIIAVSQAVASQLRSDAIAPAQKISVVLNGIDTARFQAAREKFARRQFLQGWELPEDSSLVGTIGELTPLKGQEDFLRSAVEILKKQPTAYFIIAGIDHSRGNKYRSYLEHLIEELNLKERVRLVGWMDDLAQLYCALDVFVSASRTESFGLGLAEAMASGAAVVATETEGARELVQRGETGLLVPVGDFNKLADAVLLLLKDSGSRTRLGTNAQRSASSNFSLERMIGETEEIYRTEIQRR